MENSDRSWVIFQKWLANYRLYSEAIKLKTPIVQRIERVETPPWARDHISKYVIAQGY